MTETKKNRALCVGVLGLLFLVQMLMHLNCDTLLADDQVFYSVLDSGRKIGEFLSKRWQGWSSRLLIEGTLCLTAHSIWAWRVLNCLLRVLLCWSVARLANAQKRPEMLALAAALITAIPFSIMRSTGWEASSVNYDWPLSLCAFALIPLADALWGKKTGKGAALLSLPAAVFAANQEQISVLMVGALLIFGGALLIRERRARPLLLALLVIAASEMAAHLLCPGNAVRAAKSAAIVNLRDHAAYTLIDKLSVCFTSTTALLFFCWCPMLLGCWTVVAASAASRRRGMDALILTAVPALFMLLCFALRSCRPWMDAVGTYYGFVLQLGPVDAFNGWHYLMMAALVFIVCALLMGPYLSLGERPGSACAALIVALCFAARMAVALSPTVVESGERTMLPLYGGMILCALLSARGCREEGGDARPLAAALVVCCALAAANVLSSFALAA